MENTRQNKIARLVQRALGEIFQIESRNIFFGAMISVTKVNVTRDLSLARNYISIFATDKTKEVVFEQVITNKSYLRKLLGQKIGKQVRAIPDIDFFIDDSLDYIENIEKLLKE